MSSFYGLHIAKSGLFFSQKAMQLAGHNIANVNTTGYTRQRLIGENIAPATGPTFIAPAHKGRIGGGVDLQTIDQIRDEFLDRELRRENAEYTRLQTTSDTLIYVESVFDETMDDSISKTMAEFFDSLHKLSADEVSKELRTNVRSAALNLTDAFNHYYTKLVEMQKLQNQSMEVVTGEINDLLTGIADYNKQIYAYELSGDDKALDLRDHRNVMLDELSKLVDINYSEDSMGRLSVYVGNQRLIRHNDVTYIKAVADDVGVVTGEPDFFSIYLDNDSVPATPLEYSSGKLESYRKMRDGKDADDFGIPRIISNLNDLARSLANEMNAIHAAGWTYPHDDDILGHVASTDGINFFAPPGADFNAGMLSISDDIKRDVYMIAGSSVEIDFNAQPNPQPGNNKNLLDMIELASAEGVVHGASFEGYLKTVIVELATESGHVERLTSGQLSVIANLESRRESVSGVSIDEEITLLLQFQHMYSASSRMITVIDEALDKLINSTGRVGL